jgi:hypothetical protein
LIQTRCSILPSIADRTKNTKLKKHLYKNNACSHRSITWQTDAIGLWKCDLGLPSHLSPRQLQQYQSGNFPIVSFIKTGSGIQKLIKGDSQTAWGSHKPTFIFSK